MRAAHAPANERALAAITRSAGRREERQRDRPVPVLRRDQHTQERRGRAATCPRSERGPPETGATRDRSATSYTVTIVPSRTMAVWARTIPRIVRRAFTSSGEEAHHSASCRELQERLLERRDLGDELVQDDAVRRSDLLPLGGRSSPTRADRLPTSPTLIPASSRTARNLSACGERTRNPPAARAASSAVAACSTNLPRWMITTSSAICSISARTWLEMKIVRLRTSERAAPEASECPGRGRSPARRGSAPAGRRAARPARLSRWRMPSE